MKQDDVNRLRETLDKGESKQEQIDKAQANLDLPDQPPKASDWQSMDATTVNVGSGRTEAPVGTGAGATVGSERGPPTVGTDADMSKVGRQGVEGLNNPPKDASY